MTGSGGGGGVKIPQSPSDIAQANILNNLETSVGQPIRNAVVPQAIQTLGGPGVYQTSLPAPDRKVIEDQYSQARNDTLNSGQRGGQLRTRLADLGRSRADAVSSATNQASQRGIERALGLVPAAIPNAGAQLSAGSQLAQNDTTRLANQADLSAKAAASQGQGMGSMLGGALSLVPLSV